MPFSAGTGSRVTAGRGRGERRWRRRMRARPTAPARPRQPAVVPTPAAEVFGTGRRPPRLTQAELRRDRRDRRPLRLVLASGLRDQTNRPDPQLGRVLPPTISYDSTLPIDGVSGHAGVVQFPTHRLDVSPRHPIRPDATGCGGSGGKRGSPSVRTTLASIQGRTGSTRVLRNRRTRLLFGSYQLPQLPRRRAPQPAVRFTSAGHDARLRQTATVPSTAEASPSSYAMVRHRRAP